jgi:hypothetical protein
VRFCGTGATCAEEEVMKKSKNWQFCMDTLKSLQNEGEFEPEQKSALEGAQKGLRKLRRKTNPSREEIYRVVRQVAEAILNILNSD